MKVTLEQEPAAADVQFVNARLREHNLLHAEDDEHRPLGDLVPYHVGTRGPVALASGCGDGNTDLEAGARHEGAGGASKRSARGGARRTCRTVG